MKNVEKPKILLFDIESSNLAANIGFTICVGYKWLGEKKTHIISITDNKKMFKDDPTNDRYVIEAFAKIAESADLCVAHYGGGFDIPFLQTRALEHGLPVIGFPALVDTWRAMKFKLKFNSNRLETLSRSLPYLNEKTAPRKTTLDFKMWRRGSAGHLPSIKQIEHHCVMDIRVLEDAYLALRPFISSHPYLHRLHDNKKEACPSCGSENVQRRGVAVTAKTKMGRLQCQKCSRWYMGKAPKEIILP